MSNKTDKTKTKGDESRRDDGEYRLIEKEYLRFPFSYFTTPFRSPPGFPTLPASQRRYFYLDIHPPSNVEEKATILLLHGFPDSSFGWRKIVEPLAKAGYRLIVPDLLGYGRTSKPKRLEEYSAQSLAFDLADLMTFALSKGEGRNTHQNRFAVLGHDWGSWLAWKLPLWIPERLLGVHGLCISYVPPTNKFVSTAQLAERYSQFGYQMFFEEERSTKIIEEKIQLFLKLLFIAPSKLIEKVPSEQILKVFGAGKGALESNLQEGLQGEIGNAFEQASVLSKEENLIFRTLFDPLLGGSMDSLKWYRTRKINYDEERALPSKMLPKLPYKILCPNMDPTGPASIAEKARDMMPAGTPYTVQEVEGSGHWIMLEKSEEVIESVKEWMEKDVLPFHASLYRQITSRL